MKAYKVEVLVIDHDGYGPNDIRVTLEQPRGAYSMSVLDMEVADIGEWEDDHPLNFTGRSMIDECNRLFAKKTQGE